MATTASVLFTRSTVSVNHKAQGGVEIVNTGAPKTIRCIQVVALGGPHSIVMPQIAYQTGAAGAEGAVLAAGPNTVASTRQFPFEIISFSPAQPYAPNVQLRVMAVVTFTDETQVASGEAILEVRPFTSLSSFEAVGTQVFAGDEATGTDVAGNVAAFQQNTADAPEATDGAGADTGSGEGPNGFDGGIEFDANGGLKE